MTLLEVNDLSVRYGELTIVDRVGFSLDAGQWLILAGPNGAGKSTIVNAISQGCAYTGSIRYCGKDLRSFRARERAKRIGVLTQTHHVSYPFTIAELVRLGRYAHAPNPFAAESDAEAARVETALRQTGLTELRDRSVLTLSGGELQRAFLAQLLLQDPRVLILDEPTNHLDPVYQKQTFELLSRWLNEGSERAIVSVVHDLSLARAFGTHALLLKGGHALSYGKTCQALTDDDLSRAYDMDVCAWMRDLLSRWE